MGQSSESGSVGWKVPNSRRKHFPHINFSTGHVNPQFHVVFAETYSTVPALKIGSVPASWKFISENIRQLTTYEDLNLADLWSKSERESGVKFDIQTDATNKNFNNQKMMHWEIVTQSM